MAYHSNFCRARKIPQFSQPYLLDIPCLVFPTPSLMFFLTSCNSLLIHWILYLSLSDSNKEQPPQSRISHFLACTRVIFSILAHLPSVPAFHAVYPTTPIFSAHFLGQESPFNVPLSSSYFAPALTLNYCASVHFWNKTVLFQSKYRSE